MRTLKDKAFKIYRKNIISDDDTGGLAESVESLKVVPLSNAEQEIKKLEKDEKALRIGNVSNLLPCPFCGSRPSVHQRQNDYWEVRCLNDENCSVIVMTDEKINKKTAIKSWNRRVM